MERRGSGLRKIINETAKLPGYTEELRPTFYSTPSSFTVIVKNVNYNLDVGMQDTAQDTVQDTAQDKISALIDFCSTAKTRVEMQLFCGLASREYFRKSILLPLLKSGKLKMTIPEKPNSRNQKYIKA